MSDRPLGHHRLECEYGYIHSTCRCIGPHATTKIVCNDPAHQKEHCMTMIEKPEESVEELEARLAALRESAGVTPEAVAATAPDEADDEHVHEEGGYHIHPASEEDADDEEADAEPNTLTAFLVIVGVDGAAFATSELEKVDEIVPSRPATVVDMRRACQEVVFDVNAMQISQQTVAIMQQSAQEMAEAKRNEAIAQKLVSKGVKLPRR